MIASSVLYKLVTRCRVCDRNLPAPALDFGYIPVGDALSQHANDDTNIAPLALHHCPSCELLQLGSHLDPRAIFNHHYPYFSSAIDSLVDRMESLAQQLTQQYHLSSKSRVLEIASNDGYLLQHFKHLHIQVRGVEPSTRQAAVANSKGIPTDSVFFNTEYAKTEFQQRGGVDLLIANNVVAHVPDVNDFLNGVAQLLNHNGVAIFEFHDAEKLLAREQFDTLYHQHIFYFSRASFTRLLAQHNLTVQQIDAIDAYGGSLRVHAKKTPDVGDIQTYNIQSSRQTKTACTSQQQNQEAANLTHSLESQTNLADFANNAKQRSAELHKIIAELHASGKRIAAYGAAAKASTLLSLSQLDAPLIEYIVDQNPHKSGLYMPASALQIKPVTKLKSTTSDYLLILAWNYADEIMSQLSWFSRGGGRFIIPTDPIKII